MQANVQQADRTQAGGKTAEGMAGSTEATDEAEELEPGKQALF